MKLKILSFTSLFLLNSGLVMASVPCSDQSMSEDELKALSAQDRGIYRWAWKMAGVGKRNGWEQKTDEVTKWSRYEGESSNCQWISISFRKGCTKNASGDEVFKHMNVSFSMAPHPSEATERPVGVNVMLTPGEETKAAPFASTKAIFVARWKADTSLEIVTEQKFRQADRGSIYNRLLVRADETGPFKPLKEMTFLYARLTQDRIVGSEFQRSCLAD